MEAVLLSRSGKDWDVLLDVISRSVTSSRPLSGDRLMEAGGGGGMIRR